MSIQPHNFISLDASHVQVTLHNNKSMVFACGILDYYIAVEKYHAGLMIQDAFSFLSDTEREFLLTGMTASEQDEFYSQSDDESQGEDNY